MKIAVGSSQTTSNISSSGRSFGIKANGKAFKILSSQLYNFKPLAVVREISCNARDAHAMSGILEKPFHVRLPSMEDAHFVVRDFGPGLSEDDIFGLYTTYFQSNKTDSNDAIGGLGLGSKSPLSYSNSFQVTSYHGGMKRTYLAFQNDNGEPDIYRLTESVTDEPTGLEVIVPVLESDIRKFHRSAVNVFRFFQVRPIVHVGKTLQTDDMFYEFDIDDRELECVEYQSGMFGRFYTDSVVSEISTCSVWARMGDVIYPVSIQHAFEDSRSDEAAIATFYNNARYGKLIIDCAIGELDINAGREGLSYDKTTIARLKTILSMIYSKLVQQVNSRIAQAEYLDEALNLCRAQVTFFGNIAVKGMFSWRGNTLTETDYSTVTQLVKNVPAMKALADAVRYTNKGGQLRYSAVIASRGGLAVRALYSANIDRTHMNFGNPVTLLIVDEPTAGTKGTLKERIRVTFGEQVHYNRNVLIMRAVDMVFSGATGSESAKLAHKPVAEQRAALRSIVESWDVFADVRFLSEIESCAVVSTGGGSSGGAGRTLVPASPIRTTEEVYAVTASSGWGYHLTRNESFHVLTLDEDPADTKFYLVGNKSKITFQDHTIGVSRSSESRYNFNGSYATDLLHRWAEYRTSVKTVGAASTFTIHYVTEKQAARLASNPKWVRVEDQLIADAGLELSKLKPFWNATITTPSLYDRDVFKAAMTSKSFAADVEEWNARAIEVAAEDGKLPRFVSDLIRNVPSLIDSHWERLLEAAGQPLTTDRTWIDQFKKSGVELSFQQFVGLQVPLFNVISQRNSGWGKNWEADVCRLWDTTPNKITVQYFIEQKLKGTI